MRTLISLVRQKTEIRLTLKNFCFYFLLCLIALGPLYSKFIGAALFAVWAFGLFVVFKQKESKADYKCITVSSSSCWRRSCLIALCLAGISALIWHEKISSLNAEFRLFLTAAVAACIAYYRPLSPRTSTKLLHAIASACVLAFVWIVFLQVRQLNLSVRASLPSNAIAWAAVISFYICLLLPAALTDESNSSGRRWFWLVSVACGLGAILLSESRGAFLILPWCILVYACFLQRKYSRNGSLRGALSICIGAVAMVLAAAWFGPGDILRMHQAAQDIKQIQSSENYNTSVGARLYLWNMALDGIRESPWIGIGGVERMRRIHHAGEGGSAEQQAKLAVVRPLNYVHNQYLNAALDGGLIGLSSFLILLIGMAIAVCRLARLAPIAAWQLGGVLFMHATASLTNVNLVHNYYATALALAVVFPLLSASHAAVQTGNSSYPY